MLTITHTAAEGTLIDGTSRGDGTAPILKTHHWRWGHSIASWYLPHSRDRAPQRYRIDQVAQALRAAGFTVEVTIDATPRDPAEAEAERADRADTRADRLAERSARHQAASDAAHARADRLTERFAGGQPILVGHYSEKSARNALDKAHNAIRRGIDEGEYADELARRSDVAAASTGARHNPVTVANRIAKFEADLRRWQRSLAKAQPGGGYEQQCREQIAQLETDIAYWKAVRAQQIADGVATNYSRDTVKKGDLVKIRGSWCVVARANAKTVAAQSRYMPWPLNSPWAEVQDHRPAGQDPEGGTR